jgi:hypothetical protein
VPGAIRYGSLAQFGSQTLLGEPPKGRDGLLDGDETRFAIDGAAMVVVLQVVLKDWHSEGNGSEPQPSCGSEETGVGCVSSTRLR